jgi:hypothetical protein
VTYLYGCTDSTYEDPTCPWKCGESFEDKPYVGLDYCVNTTTNEWSCTHPPDNSDAIQPFPAQQCYEDSIIAFAGPAVLQPILSLPEVQGSATVWFSQINPTSWTPDPNYTPTSTSIQVTASVPTKVELVSTSSTTTTSSSTITSSSSSSSGSPTRPQAGQTASNTAPPSSTTSSDGGGGLSSGAKIGIGVGVGVGAVGLLALGAAIFLIRRRRSGHDHQPVSQIDYHSAGAFPDETKDKRPRPPSELPASTKYDSPSGYGASGYGTSRGTGTGSGYGNSSTGANWDSPVPTYSANNEPVAGPRPAGHDRLHELAP